MNNKGLYVSFWNICLENLAEGSLTHNRIKPQMAKQLIKKARESDRLLCLSDTDLLAPYHKKERADHEAFCQVLKEHYGFDLSLKDFLSHHKDEKDPYYVTNALSCAQIKRNKPLLVVTCAYVLSKERAPASLELEIDPKTVRFHLVESF